MDNMKINEDFINLLLEKREALVYRLLNEEGLNYFVEKELKEGLPLHKYNKNSLEPLEDVVYTVKFLIDQELVEKITKHSVAIPDFGEVQKDIDRFNWIEEEFEKIYGLMLKVKPELFDYKKRGYKTEKQEQELKNIHLIIKVAILSVLFGFLLSEYYLGLINFLLKAWKGLGQILN